MARESGSVCCATVTTANPTQSISLHIASRVQPLWAVSALAKLRSCSEPRRSELLHVVTLRRGEQSRRQPWVTRRHDPSPAGATCAPFPPSSKQPSYFPEASGHSHL